MLMLHIWGGMSLFKQRVNSACLFSLSLHSRQVLVFCFCKAKDMCFVTTKTRPIKCEVKE